VLNKVSGVCSSWLVLVMNDCCNVKVSESGCMVCCVMNVFMNVDRINLMVLLLIWMVCIENDMVIIVVMWGWNLNCLLVHVG